MRQIKKGNMNRMKDYHEAIASAGSGKELSDILSEAVEDESVSYMLFEDLCNAVDKRTEELGASKK